MSKWHPLVDPKQKGATAESNFDDMAVIRQMPPTIPNPQWDGENTEFIDNPKRRALINNMVKANIPFVIAKVEIYISLEPSVEYMYDDLVAEGTLRLLEVIIKLADMDTPECGGNPTGYIGQYLVWTMARLIENDIKQQIIPKNYRPSTPAVIDPMDIVDTRDLIESVCLTEEDRILVDMREHGCTDEEIAARLDINRRAVTAMRCQLVTRYKRALEKE